MSRHDGVSCDSCLIANFRGKRYKCLICYDYDLCATCYEAGATTTRHTTEHPMQCILTRTDFEVYYGGEAVSVEQPQSFTCPFCGKMGFTETTLQIHVSAEHTDTSFEVVCPVCAALPGGDPNLVTDDFAAHLTLEHRGSREIDEPSSSRHVRRIPHPGRGVGASRARRSNMHFSASGGLASMSPGSRESMDPIAELLSQLSGVRRGGGASQSSTTTQLQQLQMQLQLERQQAQVARQQLERLPRRTAQIASGIGSGSAGVVGSAATASSAGGSGGVIGGNGGGNSATAMITVQPALVVDSAFSRPAASGSYQYLLTRCTGTAQSDAELQQSEVSRADRSFFVRELLMDALIEGLSLDGADNNAISGVLKIGSLGLTDEATPPFPAPAKSAAVGAAAAAAAAAPPQATPRNAPSSAGQASEKKTSHCQQGKNSGGGGSGGSGARSGSSRQANSSVPLVVEPQQQQQQQQPHQHQHQQQQQHGTTSSHVAGRNSHNQGQQQPPQHHQQQHQQQQQQQQHQLQRMASSGTGTGTVREVSAVVQQPAAAVVTSGRIPVRSGTSPSSSTRRKLLRHMDGRNQPNEPPPPH